MKAAAPLLLAGAALLALAGPAAADPKRFEDIPEARAEYLYGVPAGLDPARYLDRPELLGSAYSTFQDPVTGEKRLTGYAEAVAIYDLPIADLLAVLMDFEGSPKFVPYMLSAATISRAGDTWLVRNRIGINFLGSTVGYEAEFETTVDAFPDGSVGLRTRMARSLDGSLYESFNSFYLAPVTVQGRTMCFVRYFSRPGIRKPFVGMLAITKTFTPGAAKSQIEAVVKEARRRRPH